MSDNIFFDDIDYKYKSEAIDRHENEIYYAYLEISQKDFSQMRRELLLGVVIGDNFISDHIMAVIICSMQQAIKQVVLDKVMNLCPHCKQQTWLEDFVDVEDRESEFEDIRVCKECAEDRGYKGKCGMTLAHEEKEENM